jgi:hypothetical protein
MSKKKLPTLRESHAPQYGPRPIDDFFKRCHSDMVEQWPESYQHADPLPYGIWITDTHEYLFDRQYRPIWKRQPGQPAAPATPAEWVNWKVMYFLHDDKPQPRHSKVLRRALAMVVEEFCAAVGFGFGATNIR